MFKRNFQRKIAFLLFFLLLLTATGQWILLSVLRKHAKLEAQENLENYYQQNPDLLSNLHFSTKEANAFLENEEREFTYQGVMYDIVSIQFEKDSIFISAFADKKETEIVKKVQAALNDFVDLDSQNSQEGGHKKINFKNIFSKYLKCPPPSINGHFDDILLENRLKIPIAAASLLPFGVRACDVPPPKFACVFG